MQHLGLVRQVKYAERSQREDEWLALDHTQFGWQSEPGTAPNPTFHPTLTPKDEAALDNAVLLPLDSACYLDTCLVVPACNS